MENNKITICLPISPAPEKVRDYWLFGGEIFLSDSDMESHLFHNVYGNNGTPIGSAYDSGGDKIGISVNGKGGTYEIKEVFASLKSGVWVWLIELACC